MTTSCGGGSVPVDATPPMSVHEVGSSRPSPVPPPRRIAAEVVWPEPALPAQTRDRRGARCRPRAATRMKVTVSLLPAKYITYFATAVDHVVARAS